MMMMRLVAAALVGTAAAVKVTSRNALVYSTVTPKLRLQGEGFAGDGTNIHLTFVPALDPSKYSVLVTSETSLSVLLKGSATWPLGEGAVRVQSLFNGVSRRHAGRRESVR